MRQCGRGRRDGVAERSTALHAAIERDGYLFVRRLVPIDVARLRRLVLEHARSVSWLDPTADRAGTRPCGARIATTRPPIGWLQSRVQTSAELWDVGDTPCTSATTTRPAEFPLPRMNTVAWSHPTPSFCESAPGRALRRRSAISSRSGYAWRCPARLIAGTGRAAPARAASAPRRRHCRRRRRSGRGGVAYG